MSTRFGAAADDNGVVVENGPLGPLGIVGGGIFMVFVRLAGVAKEGGKFDGGIDIDGNVDVVGVDAGAAVEEYGVAAYLELKEDGFL